MAALLWFLNFRTAERRIDGSRRFGRAQGRVGGVVAAGGGTVPAHLGDALGVLGQLVACKRTLVPVPGVIYKLVVHIVLHFS